MLTGPILYYITDRKAFALDEPNRGRHLLEKIAEATRSNVDYIQLREKDLSTRELESLARESVAIVQRLRTENRELRTVLLMNSRTDIALATGADGVHLRSEDITPKEVRTIWERATTAGAPCLADFARRGNSESKPVIGVSRHTAEEVRQAAADQATFAVFAPVFEKQDSPGTQPAGLTKLREACRVNIPVLALGGITLANAQDCLNAGAAGIAAIRLFQENNLNEVARRLRGNG